MKSTLVVASSALGLVLGWALPPAADATTPCRAQCQSEYNICLANGGDPGACFEQRSECYNSCIQPPARADLGGAAAAPFADLQERFRDNAQRRPLPLPKSV